jgi:hypothetical protein
MRQRGYSWTDYTTSTETGKELNMTQVLVKIQEYKRNWLQHVNRMPHNRLQRILGKYRTKGRRNQGKPLKETSRYMRPGQQVVQLHVSLMMMMMMMKFVLHITKHCAVKACM